MEALRARLSALVTRRPGLRVRIAALVVSGLFILFVVFAVLASIALYQSREHALQNQAAIARLAADHVDFTIIHFEALLRFGEKDQAIELSSSSAEARRGALREIATAFGPEANAVFLADQDLRILIAEPDQALEGSTIPLADEAKAKLQAGSPAVTGLTNIDSVHSQPALILQPLDTPAGSPPGFIGVVPNFKDEDVVGWLSPLTLGETGYAEVVDERGVVIMSTVQARLFEETDHGEYLRGLIQQGKSSVDTCHDCHTPGAGKEMRRDVLAFAPLHDAPWGVAVRQAEDEALAPSNHLFRQILVLAVISVIAGMAIVWITTLRLLKPVVMLTAASRRLARGDLDTPVPAMGEDEVGVLAKSFEVMRERLKASIDSIRDWNRELDARVQARTKELQASRDELQRSRDYLQAIIDSIGDGLMVVDRRFRVSLVNQALARAYRAQPGDFVGQQCYTVVPDVHHECHGPHRECAVAKVLQTGEPARALHKQDDEEGGVTYTKVVANPLRDAAGNVAEVVEILRDVTEEKKLEQEILHRNQELASLNAVAGVVSQSLKLDGMLNAALEKVLEVLGAEIGVIHLRDTHTGTLELAAYRGLPREAADAIANLKGSDSCGGVGQAWGPVYVEDVSKYRGSRRSGLRDVGLRSMVQVPMKSKGVVLGGMCVATREHRQFTAAEFDLLNSIAGQIAVAVENAQLYEEVRLKEKIRGELLDKVITAQEEERKRIARELHDDTSQALVALVAAIEAVSAQEDMVEARQRLMRIRPLATRSLEEINKLIFDLRPTLLDDMGLLAAIRWYAETRLQAAGVHVHVEINGTERRLEAHTETSLFRVVQEAITNIAKHAEAENVSISLEFTTSSLIIEIEDDGKGFDPAKVEFRGDGGRGLGLLGMRERVTFFEGRLDIYSQPGGGVRVVVEVPLEPVGVGSYE